MIPKILATALIYFALAKLSFLTALPASPAGPSLIWLPTGFAVAALLRWGYRVWPGVALGSLLNSFPNTTGLGGVLGFLLANTADPLLAVWLPRKLMRRELDLSCTWDVTVFLLCVVFGSSALSASIGCLTILLSGMGMDASLLVTWLVWWVSDFLGVFLLAPMLALREHVPHCTDRPASWAEIAAGSVMGAGLLAFGFTMPLGANTLHFVYWLTPFVIWLAFRGGYFIATKGVFLLAVAVVAGTSQNVGPFVGGTIYESFLFVQAFLTVVVVLSLLLTASVSERGRAIKDRDDFILLASHELKTPLTALGIQAHFLHELEEKGELEKLTSERRRELLKINNKEVRRLSGLVEDLLESARIAGGRLTLRPSLVSLREVVNAALRDQADELAGSGSEVSVRGDSVTGNWDRRKLGYVVRAMLANALKHGEGNPISVAIEQRGANAVLLVADQGAGISEADQDRIFHRFVRLTELRSFGGLGQGLFIACAIVKAHGGSIKVSSALGKGTVMRVELPVQPGAKA